MEIFYIKSNFPFGIAPKNVHESLREREREMRVREENCFTLCWLVESLPAEWTVCIFFFNHKLLPFLVVINVECKKVQFTESTKKREREKERGGDTRTTSINIPVSMQYAAVCWICRDSSQKFPIVLLSYSLITWVFRSCLYVCICSASGNFSPNCIVPSLSLSLSLCTWGKKKNQQQQQQHTKKNCWDSSYYFWNSVHFKSFRRAGSLIHSYRLQPSREIKSQNWICEVFCEKVFHFN